MRKTRAIAALVIVAAGLSACRLPRDPGGTTSRVENGVLRIGVSDNPPWATRAGGGLVGVEPELVRTLASREHAQTVWTIGSETRLMPALKRGDLDLVIGGFTADNPWAKTVAVTRPYAELAGRKQVLFAPPGENRWLLVVDTFLADRARGHGDGQGAP
jgi:polar amino acid transport system substrate-binding protein